MFAGMTETIRPLANTDGTLVQYQAVEVARQARLSTPSCLRLRQVLPGLCFTPAYSVAIPQASVLAIQANAVELRAALSLSRLWHQQG